eukprot:EG_transcript_9571
MAAPLHPDSPARHRVRLLAVASATLGLALALVYVNAPLLPSVAWAPGPHTAPMRRVSVPSLRPTGPTATTAQWSHTALPDAPAETLHSTHREGPTHLRLSVAPALSGRQLLAVPVALAAVAALLVSGLRRPRRAPVLAMLATTSRRPLNGKRLLVLGGSGYLGQRICRYAVKNGYRVVSLSRRGPPPIIDDFLAEVKWRKGDATNPATVQMLIVEGFDAVVHAVGLLFDSESGLAQFNTIVSGSKSEPDDDATYDLITRRTAELAIDSVLATTPVNKQLPVAFISAAEAGWPEVPGGNVMDFLAPNFLKRYLAAKRTVEAKLLAPHDAKIRPLIFRPSLLWDWTKWDVLPIIPVFWLASAAGVPFIDRPMFADDLAKAVVAAVDDDTVAGPLRFPAMDELAARDRWEF